MIDYIAGEPLIRVTPRNVRVLLRTPRGAYRAGSPDWRSIAAALRALADEIDARTPEVLSDI